MLASMDANGTVFIRCISEKADPEVVLYTITSIPQDQGDYARVLMNAEMPNSEGELLVVVNDQVLVLDMSGRQVASMAIDDEVEDGRGQLLALEYVPILDNKFLYKLLCNTYKQAILEIYQ